MELDEKTLKFIFESNIEVMGHVNTPSGFTRVQLGVDDYKKYLEDPDQFAADHYQVDLSVYHRWMKLHGAPQCGMKTSQGKRCKKPCGGNQTPMREWLLEDGGLCALHEAEGAEGAGG